MSFSIPVSFPDKQWSSGKAELELRRAEGGLVPEGAVITWILSLKTWAVFPGGFEITVGVEAWL